MSRYFFHLHDGVQHFDEDGTDLHGPEKAHSEAIIMAGEMLKDIDGHFTRENRYLRVMDDANVVVSDIMIVVRRKKPA